MKTVVGVLRGGPSSEYEVSLKSGASVLASLNREKFEPRDVFIDRAGIWHVHGAPMAPEQALRGVDVAFNAMHGEYGEDGEVQRILDAFNVPYTGSGVRESALAFDKHHTKEAIKKLGISTPRALVITQAQAKDPEALAFEIFRTFPHPAVVKPAQSGSSVGVTIVKNFHALAWGIEHALEVSPKIIIEEYIPGREATVGVIDNFRNENTYVLPPIEIVPPPQNGFYDYEAKYLSDDTNYRIPSSFSEEEKVKLVNTARAVHEGLGLSHYSRSDFIVSSRGIYFLEVNTLPGMTSHSLIPKALEAVGAKMPDFLEHVVTLARQGKQG